MPAPVNHGVVSIYRVTILLGRSWRQAPIRPKLAKAVGMNVGTLYYAIACSAAVAPRGRHRIPALA